MSDKELQDALRVEPSPEFLARVRTRIANEPAPSAWRRSWTFGAAGAIAAGVAIAVVVSRPAPDPIARLKPRATPEAPPVSQAFGPAVPQRIAPPSAGPQPRVRLEPRTNAVPVVSGVGRTSVEPETLIDPREGIALRRLLAGVRAGRVDLAAATNASASVVMDLPPIQELVIPALTIDPLTPSGEQGARP